MKYRHITFGCLFLILFLSLSYFYNLLYPVRHFNSQNLPAPVTPDKLANEKNSEIQKKSRPKNMEQHLEPSTINEVRFNVLILGIDAREKEKSRSDVIMLVNVNPKSKQINILSIPRDTRVKIWKIGYTKINHAHLIGETQGGNSSGTQAALRAVSNLCDSAIHYYVKVNFAGFKHFIDTIGGVDIVLSQPLKLTFSDLILPAGKQHINGELALMLVRERYSLPDGDFGRQKHQVLILKALAQKLLEVNFIPKIPKLIKQVKNDIIDTNFTDSGLISLAWMFQGTSTEKIKYMQVPGKEGYDFDPYVQKRLYYWFPELNKLKGITKEFLATN